MGLFDEQSGDLVTFWKTKSAITSIVGSGSAARIWPDAARQGAATPYAIYTQAGGRRLNHLTSHSKARLTVLHVYSWADTRASADALAEAIRTSSINYRGTMGSTVVMFFRCDDSPDTGYDSPVDGSDIKRFWTRDIYRIAHQET